MHSDTNRNVMVQGEKKPSVTGNEIAIGIPTKPNQHTQDARCGVFLVIEVGNLKVY